MIFQNKLKKKFIVPIRTNLLGLFYTICSERSELYEEKKFAENIQRIVALSDLDRYLLFEYPPFYIWLRSSLIYLAKRSSNLIAKEELYLWISELGGLLDRWIFNKDNPNKITLTNTNMAILRFNVDPLIPKVSPPSYIFPSKEEEKELDKKATP